MMNKTLRLKQNTSHVKTAPTKTIIALIVASTMTTSFITQAKVEEVTEVEKTAKVSGSLSSEKTSEPDSKSGFYDLWDFADLYENEEGDYFKLSGRLQLDSAWVDSEQGNYDETSWRRFRFGFKAKDGDFTYALEADINLNNDFGDAYNRLTDANVTWALNKDIDIKVLKQSTGFTLDGRTSSKKLLTLQRNNLTNNLWFTKEYFTGVSVKSQLSDSLSTKAGIYSSDASDEISISEASYFAVLSTTKKLSKNSLWDKAQLNFDYVYNDVHVDGDTNDFSQIVSASSKFTKNDWGLQSDISFGKGEVVEVDGFEQSNLFGVVIMPTYDINKEIQLVSRFTYLKSSEDNGVRLGRYDNDVVDARGDKYQEIYAGVNWFLNGHKLKLQAGLQYAKMDDNANDGGAYDGWNFTVGLRSYW